jgi:SAM-dependent methyltransferase
MRYRELEFAFGKTRRFASAARRVLDISSPKWVSVALAHHMRNAQVRAVNAFEDDARQTAAHARILGLHNLDCEVQDARSLGFPDNSYDLVVSRSDFRRIALEEGAVPQVSREVGRVLAPGGTAILTVPFPALCPAAEGTHEVCAGDEGKGKADQCGCDDGCERLMDNFVAASGLKLRYLGFIDERFLDLGPRKSHARHESGFTWQHLPFGSLRLPLSRLIFSAPKPLAWCRRPQVACVVMQKPRGDLHGYQRLWSLTET